MVLPGLPGQAAQERAAEGEGEQEQQETAAGEEQPLFQHDTPALSFVRFNQKSHGSPHHRFAAAMHKEMNDDGNGNARKPGGEQRGMKESHATTSQAPNGTLSASEGWLACGMQKQGGEWCGMRVTDEMRLKRAKPGTPRLRLQGSVTRTCSS